VRWTAAEVLLILFLAPLWASVSSEVLNASGFSTWMYGPELVALARSTPIEGVDATPRQLAQFRLLLWSGCLTFVLQLSSILFLLYALSGTRPRDIGLTSRRLGTNLLAGVLSALALIPAVYALNYLVTQVYGTARVQEHPFAQLLKQDLMSVERLALFAAAVIAAPVGEELLFRGILQPYCATRSWGPHAAMIGAFLLALAARGDQILAAWRAGSGSALLHELAPALTLLTLVPIYLLVWWRSRTPLVPALLATAILFGWIHARVWPSPVALTLFGLGLGYLAYRTQSLVGPIVLHAVFNAAAFALLTLP
jgi:membrane protease YdiL (CAAX protease family)